MGEIQLEMPGLGDLEPSDAALKRHWMELGQEHEEARHIYSLLGDRGRYVHTIQLRWPTAKNKDVLLIVKSFTEDGCFVAFHAGPLWINLINSFAARVRAGAVEWVKDEYPPDNWVEKLAILVALPRIRR